MIKKTIYHLDITCKFFSNTEVLSNPSVSRSMQFQERERLFNYYIQHLIRDIHKRQM